MPTHSDGCESLLRADPVRVEEQRLCELFQMFPLLCECSGKLRTALL